MKENTISVKFPYESKYIDIKGSKIHYIDEGEGDPVLFIHGNPTSSYIWRNIIPHLKSNSRCIALDLIGFGKSDKPDIDYGFTDSYAYLEAFIRELGLKNITIVVQDWGSGLGFHYANLHRENIKGIAFMEAMYKQVRWEELATPDKFAMKLIRSKFTSWLMLGVANLFVKNFINEWTNRDLSKDELIEYQSPFENLKSRKPVYVFPRDVPVGGSPLHTSNVVDSYHRFLQETKIPKICFYSTPGMLIRKDDANWISENFPNTTMVDIGEGVHYVQEDNPHQIGEELSNWYRRL